MKPLTAVSAVMLTYNERLNVEACLKSVAGWCQEVFVVDSGSTDGTQEIVVKYTDRLFFHSYTDHASQWQWAFSSLPLNCEWLLLLDADNIVSEKLKAQIDRVVALNLEGIDGYYSYHTHYFRGKRVRGLKSYWLRLVRHKNVRIDSSELVDFRMIMKGRAGKLSGEIVEHNLKENDIDFWIDKHQKFATRMAVEEVLRVEGLLNWSDSLRPHLFGNPDERMLWFKNRWYRMPMYVRPFLYFVYRYFWKLSLLDGVGGFTYSFLQGFWFRLVVDMKITELRERIARGDVTLRELFESFSHKH